MLARIADSTKDNDDKLISTVNEKSESINENLKKLKTKLCEFPEIKEETPVKEENKK